LTAVAAFELPDFGVWIAAAEVLTSGLQSS